jgi:hypothetical protein
MVLGLKKKKKPVNKRSIGSFVHHEILRYLKMRRMFKGWC